MPSIGKLSDINHLQDIKGLLEDLSVSEVSDKNGFVNYPIKNIDLLKNLIIDSYYSLGLFDDRKKLIGFSLSYPLEKINESMTIYDEILSYISKNYRHAIYLDVIGISESEQNKGYAKKLLKKIEIKSQKENYKFILAPIVEEPHFNHISVKFLQEFGFHRIDSLNTGKLTFGIYKKDLN